MKWLKRVREAMGITQDALAKGTKIHQTTLSRIENGYREVDKTTEKLIISCLGGKERVERFKKLVLNNGEKKD
jgi:transcriptional regulator with XRE-family HTH domain